MIPGQMPMQGLEHYAEAEELSEQEAHELVRAGLTQMVMQEIQKEMQRRLEQTCGGDRLIK